MQILLETFNLLLFGFEGGFHLKGAMGQDLLGLLQVFNFKLLLEKLVLLLL